MRDVMTHLQREGTYFVGGTSSIWVPKGRLKYIDKSVCNHWPDLDGQTRLMTPGEACRTELQREWPDLKKVGWHRGMQSLFDKRSPLHYTGPFSGRMVYIDLVAAYSQIYEKLWLDTSYPRGYFGRYPLAGVAGRLKDWKQARNSLVGIVRSREMVAYRGTKRITIKMKNKYLSPGLWATVQGLLHWIANSALLFGAIYVNVDGYIFKDDESDDWVHFMEWLGYREVRHTIRTAGMGEIVGWNNYVIGTSRTQANKLGLITKSKEFSNVNKNDDTYRWWKYWSNLSLISS